MKNPALATRSRLPPDSPELRRAPAQPDLPLFRFRLRHLFFGVTFVSLLLAALVSLEGIIALAVLLAALVVMLHVFGTALGSQLRQHADRPAAEPLSFHERREHELGEQFRHMPRPRLPPWYGRSGSSAAWMPRLIALAVLLGGCGGAVLLSATVGQRTSLAGLLVGAISMAIVSGWLAFLGGSLIANVRGGLNEAAAGESRSDDER